MRVIVSGETSRDALHFRPPLNGLGQECDATDCVSLEHLGLRFQSGVPFDVILVRVGPDQAAALNAIQLSAKRAPVLVVGKRDLEFQAQIRRVGGRGWIEESQFRDHMIAALDGLYRDGAVKSKRGRLIGVLSAGSGMGVTTTATALAFALGIAKPDTVALAELGGDVPELALNLDLEVRYGLGTLFADWERSDPHMVRQVAVRHEEGGVTVLAHPAESLTGSTADAQPMRSLLMLLREMFEQTVLDLGHSLSQGTMEAAQMVETLIVPVRPEVPALRLTRAFLGHLRDQGVAMERVRTIASRTGYRSQEKRQDVERLLGAVPVEWIPDEPDTVIGALGAGEPLVRYSPRAGVTKAFGRVAKLLASETSK